MAGAERLRPPNEGRVGAARALIEVEAGETSDEALEKRLPRGRDRDLGWFLAMGVLRRRGEVDALLMPHLRQPLGGLEAEVRAALRLGAFELAFARTPPHAAVNEAVGVVGALGKARASGLVNAVLRRVQPPAGPAEPTINLPAWLVARWVGRYGAAATNAWARAASDAPPLTVVASDPALATAWAALPGVVVRPARAGGQEVPGAWSIDGLRGPVTDLAGWSEGKVWVQDAAAVAVADLCGAGPGSRILDACAAPGGKTMRLAATGAEVVAVDRDEPRLVRVRENLARTGLVAEVRAHDWDKGPLPGAGFDVVLVDAPCTALGTLRRSPEVRWRRQETDLASAGDRQLRILESAAGSVKPGGRLVYAVCSPEPEEGQAVVDRFLARHPDYTVDASLVTAPPSDGEDGHQAYRLVRAGAAP